MKSRSLRLPVMTALVAGLFVATNLCLPAKGISPVSSVGQPQVGYYQFEEIHRNDLIKDEVVGLASFAYNSHNRPGVKHEWDCSSQPGSYTGYLKETDLKTGAVARYDGSVIWQNPPSELVPKRKYRLSYSQSFHQQGKFLAPSENHSISLEFQDFTAAELQLGAGSFEFEVRWPSFYENGSVRKEDATAVLSIRIGGVGGNVLYHYTYRWVAAEPPGDPSANIKAAAAVAGNPDRGISEFLGTWQVSDSAGKKITIEFEADGMARRSDDPEKIGLWAVLHGGAEVRWDDGWQDRIETTPAGYRKLSFSPDSAPGSPPAYTTAAVKVGGR